MKRYRWVWRLFWVFSGIGLFLALAVAFEQSKGKVVINGIKQIKKGQTESVSLSDRVIRILARNNSQAESAFQALMKAKGLDFVCYYGRSALYRSKQKEVVARKTSLVGGFCIFELMDESYFKYMKSQIREVA